MADMSSGSEPPADGGPADNSCRALVARFLGQPFAADPTGLWTPADRVPGHSVSPHRRQLADGQTWEACVVDPITATADVGEMTDEANAGGQRAVESVRGRWTDPAFRDLVGHCTLGTMTSTGSSAYCGAPHDLENLAWASWGEPPDAATLIATCTAQAARMMQRADPSADGVLVVETSYTDGFSTLPLTPGVELPQGGFAECSLRPASTDQRLTATLVGWGEGPVPLAPR